MPAEVTSTNPVVQAVVSGSAPRQARMAAARGLLPLAQDDMLEVLVALRSDEDAEVSAAADETLGAQEPSALLGAASSNDVSPAVLSYLASRTGLARETQEAVAINAHTPDDAIAALARTTAEGAKLEKISIIQQRLIRALLTIDPVLTKPARTPKANRPDRDTHR